MRKILRLTGCSLVLILGYTVRAGAAQADVCITVDEARDTLSPQDRAAAVLLVIADHLIEHALPRRLRRVVWGGAAHAPDVATRAPQGLRRDLRAHPRNRRHRGVYRRNRRGIRRRVRVTVLRAGAGTSIRTPSTRPAITSRPNGVTVSVWY